MRIFKSLYLIPQKMYLFFAVLRNFINSRAVVNALAVLENRHKRSDSPDETALYSITTGENIFNGSTLYINLEGSMPILEEKSKWQLNEFKIDTK